MNNDDQQQQGLIKRIINWINEMKIKEEDEDIIEFEQRLKENRY